MRKKEEIMNIIFADRSRRKKGRQAKKRLFWILILLGTNMFHLNALGLDIWDTILAPLQVQALITVLMPPLEFHVGRRPRTPKNSNPILENISLGERSMTVRLGKLMRVEIFSGSFASAN